MLKKTFVALTVITLSSLTSFPVFATQLLNNKTNAIHEFRYDEFKENINNVEKLNDTIVSSKAEDATNNTNDNTDIDINSENIDNSNSEDTTGTSDNSDPGYISSFIMETTAYTGDGITATGVPTVRNKGGISTVAVDPSVIPLGSLLYIEGYGYATAADTGGAIQGNIIDLYLNSYDECINWGRRDVSVQLIAYPGQW